MKTSAQLGLPEGELSAVLIRADGTRKEYGVLRRSWRQILWSHKWLLIGLLVSAVLAVAGLYLGDLALSFFGTLGIVTTAGVNYMASDFASGGVTPTISGFKFHDCGTGTIAAGVGDTALGTPFGEARVSGTPTNPSANVYRSTATITNVAQGAQAITEWGLFSASTVGTLWDRRVFAAINWNNGDAIQFQYSLTIASGGS